MRLARLLLPVVACVLAGTGTAFGEQSRDFGDYVVHYNAVATDQLPPEAASAYNILRSANKALLNITVLEKVMGAPGSPVEAEVRAEAVNLTNQHRVLDMREVKEDGAIYYLGVLNVDDEETYDFTVHVSPRGTGKRFVVEFRRQFFTD